MAVPPLVVPPFPTVRISDLPPGPQANLTDEFHVNQEGTSRRINVGQALALAPPGQPGPPGPSGPPTGPAGGDLSGSYPNPLVRQGLIPIVPASLPPSGAAGGDLSGAYPDPTLRPGLIPIVPTTLPPSGPAGGDLSGAYPDPTLRPGLIPIVPTTLPPSGPAGGDLSGAYPDPTLRPGLIPVVPTTLPPSGPAGGELSGTYPNPTLRQVFLLDAPNDGKMYARRSGAWVEVVMPVVIPEAPLDGKTYGRKNATWVLSVGESVVVSGAAVASTPILATATTFTLNPPSPANYWNQTTQTFAPPPGVYQVNGTLSCTSTNNTANVALLMMINGVEFARATGGAAQNNIMSATLAVTVITVAAEAITFKMVSNRADMTVRTPGSGLSISGRVNAP